MRKVAICFFVHQPIRIRKFKVFDIGNSDSYIDYELNRSILDNVSNNLYVRTNNFLKKLIKKYEGKVEFSLSISGCTVEQLVQFRPDVLESFKELVDTKTIELIGGTYYNSLISHHILSEFEEQVNKNSNVLEKYLGQKPKVFRGASLNFNRDLIPVLKKLNFSSAIVNKFTFENIDNLEVGLVDNFNLILKDSTIRIIDDSTFNDSKVLFLPYDIFVEEQDIFERFELFLSKLINENVPIVNVSNYVNLSSQREVNLNYKKDINLGKNDLQKDMIEKINSLMFELKKNNEEELISDLRALTSVDYLSYTRTGKNRMVKYNPYESPYDIYMYFMNILNDIEYRFNLKKVKVEKDKMLPSRFKTNKEILDDIKLQVK